MIYGQRTLRPSAIDMTWMGPHVPSHGSAAQQVGRSGSGRVLPPRVPLRVAGVFVLRWAGALMTVG